eukprot:scaffold991_cov128-Cylindrotheca_fusiformis.AAC.26
MIKDAQNSHSIFDTKEHHHGGRIGLHEKKVGNHKSELPLATICLSLQFTKQQHESTGSSIMKRANLWKDALGERSIHALRFGISVSAASTCVDLWSRTTKRLHY